MYKANSSKLSWVKFIFQLNELKGQLSPYLNWMTQYYVSITDRLRWSSRKGNSRTFIFCANISFDCCHMVDVRKSVLSFGFKMCL